jgi:hypothetical protein
MNFLKYICYLSADVANKTKHVLIFKIVLVFDLFVVLKYITYSSQQLSHLKMLRVYPEILP